MEGLSEEKAQETIRQFGFMNVDEGRGRERPFRMNEAGRGTKKVKPTKMVLRYFVWSD